MTGLKEFKINYNGEIHKAIVVWTYELDGHIYCIYAVRDKNKNYNIYTGEIFGDMLVPVQVKDKNVVDKIALSLTNSIKR